MVTFTVGTAPNSVQRQNFVTINDDTDVEPNESFFVTFEPVDPSQQDTTNFGIGTISVTTITILDQDGKPILTVPIQSKDKDTTYMYVMFCIVAVTIGLDSVTPVEEGNNAQVCASLSGTAGTTTFPVTFSTADGTPGPNPDAIGKKILCIQVRIHKNIQTRSISNC